VGIVLAFRAAIFLQPTITRVLTSGQPGATGSALLIGKAMWARLSDPGEENADLAEALTLSSGYTWNVANYSTPISLRKAQVRWGRSSGAAAGTDDAITTHHFVKLSGGAVSDAWVAADFAGIETALAAFWASMKTYYRPETIYKQVRWYRVVPKEATPYGIELTGPPVRIIEPNVVGTNAGTTVQAPQVAASVTEKTSDAKSWGRFYLPGPLSLGTTLNTNQRMNDGYQTALANAADTFYEACVTNGTPCVVFSSAAGVRTTKAGTSLPARGSRALGVTQIQVDDLYDVIRSRRWNEPLLRLQRDIAGA